MIILALSLKRRQGESVTPPNHRLGAHGSDQTFFARKSKIEAVRGVNPLPLGVVAKTPKKTNTLSRGHFGRAGVTLWIFTMFDAYSLIYVE